MTAPRPEPIARGTLSHTPFAHILVYVLERKLQGTLELQDHKDRLLIYFRDGAPAKVDTTRDSRRLGEILLDAGVINAKQLRDSVEEMKKTGELHGQVLVRMGFIDGAALVTGITDQMTRKMVHGFVMTEAAYAFYQGVNLITGGSSELVSLDPFALLMTGVRLHGDAMPLNATVNTLRDRSFFLADADAIARYRFTREERSLCRKLLESPQDLESLKKWDVLDAETMKRMLYVLIITKTLQVVTREKVEEARRSMAPIRFDSTAPPPARHSWPPEIQTLRDEIGQMAAGISSRNYYEMLGVETGAPAAEIRTVFFRMAKKFHPDRAAKEGFEDLRETLAYIFANLSEAHSTLTDLDRRETYDEQLSSGSPPQRAGDVPAETEEEKQVRLTIEASTLFQKALVVLRQDRVDEAFAMVEKALSSCPDDGDYMAAHAYLRVKLGKAPAKSVLSVFRDAEKANPNSERVHFFFAQVLKLAEHVNEARNQFQKVQLRP